MRHFLAHALPFFGDYQDAMLNDNRFLYHAILSPYLNAGLLTPLEICEAAAEELAYATPAAWCAAAAFHSAGSIAPPAAGVVPANPAAAPPMLYGGLTVAAVEDPAADARSVSAQ